MNHEGLGDGSPQLDLDAIEARPTDSLVVTEPGDPASGYEQAVCLRPTERDALVALVRRLQQENEELRADIMFMARNRDEELTEALREGIEAMQRTREYIGAGLLPAASGWSWFDWTESARALLARIVPEKETP